MSYTFTLTTPPETPFLRHLHELVNSTHPISHENAYNQFLKNIIALTKKYPFPKKQGPLFQNELKEAEKSYPLSEKTSWGGVVLKHVDVQKNFIQKLLVIKQYGVLGFEVHQQKLEKLHVREGVCLLLSSHPEKKGKVQITYGQKGTNVVLQPGDEHGIIALSNCVIEETSTNHLTDLTYIFTSTQSI